MCRTQLWLMHSSDPWCVILMPSVNPRAYEKIIPGKLKKNTCDNSS